MATQPPPPASRSRPAPKPSAAGAPPAPGSTAAPGGAQGGAVPAPAGPGPISEEAQRQAKLEDAKFEAKAAALRAPTATRPALCSQPEIDAIRRSYTTGQVRLDALTDKCRTRLFYWQELRGEEVSLTDFQRAEAKEFFDVYGQRLEGEARVAPPNPLRPAEDERARAAAATAPAAAPPTQERVTPSEPPKETAKPVKVAPENSPNSPNYHMLVPAVGGTYAEVDYVDSAGFPWTVRVGAGTTKAEIAALMEVCGHMRGGMVAAGCKAPRPEAPRAAAQAGGQGAEVPKCKYHGKPMKPSRKPGVWMCTAIISERGVEPKQFCDYTVGGTNDQTSG